MCSLGFFNVDIRIRVLLGISGFASFFWLNGCEYTKIKTKCKRFCNKIFHLSNRTSQQGERKYLSLLRYFA
jgi:hypothetical protein